MHGTAAAGELTGAPEVPEGGRTRFEIAGPAHDAALRRLLRENPMAGQISVSMEREPSYFAAAELEGPEHQTIVAIEDGRIVCAGSVSVRQRYINGQPMRVGYLGGLRLDAACRGRASIVRRGYEAFRQLHEKGGPPLYLTSIVADNAPARRLLERGLAGMPTYRFLGEFVTLVIQRRRGGRRAATRHIVRGSDAMLPAVAELLRSQSRFQFAPCWRVDDLRSPLRCAGLRAEDFRIGCDASGTPVACAAIWDQRRVKQTVVRGYVQPLRFFRPLINAGMALLGRPQLPGMGETVRHAFVSHVAADESRGDSAEWLIALLRGSSSLSPVLRGEGRGEGSSDERRAVLSAGNLHRDTGVSRVSPVPTPQIKKGVEPPNTPFSCDSSTGETPVSPLRVDPTHARLTSRPSPQPSPVGTGERGPEAEYLTLGFDARDARLAHLRKIFRPREYVSRLYAVHWEDGAELARSLDARLLAPEVALL